MLFHMLWRGMMGFSQIWFPCSIIDSRSPDMEWDFHKISPRFSQLMNRYDGLWWALKLGNYRSFSHHKPSFSQHCPNNPQLNVPIIFPNPNPAPPPPQRHPRLLRQCPAALAPRPALAGCGHGTARAFAGGTPGWPGNYQKPAKLQGWCPRWCLRLV